MFNAFTLAVVAAFQTFSPSTCDAKATLQRLHEVVGGDPSQHARSITATGSTRADGLVSRTQEVTDLTTGRFVRDESGPVLRSRTVFDGRMVWRRDLTGGVHPLDGVDATMGALTDAYLRRYGYLRRDRAAATFRCTIAGPDARYSVVAITPRNGRGVQLWVDRRSGLVAKTVQRRSTSTATTEYDDYRQVDGFALPFLVRSTLGHDSSTLQIARYAFGKRVLPRSAFARPVTINDAEMLDGVRESSLPLQIDNGRVLVEAQVNGHSLLFQLDTGGHAILTREAAHALGLPLFGAGASGGGGESSTALQYAGPQTLGMARARLAALPFFVIAYGRDFWDRGAGRVPLAGILGLELFERFAVRLDYRHRRLTLTPLHHFRYRGAGTALPLTFEEDTPLVPARADDAAGVFQLDTGNSGGTLIFGSFLRAHHLYDRYPRGFDTTSSGTGGDVHLRTRRLRRLIVGGLRLEQFVTYFVDQRAGAFSSRTEAGNLGYDVLSQFTTTFDYRHGVAYLEPLDAAQLPAYNRAGIVVTREGRALIVAAVMNDSPAREASIVARDRLVRINGHDGATLPVASFRTWSRGAIGTPLVLDVEHGGRVRHVTLRLRELLCGRRAARCTPRVRRRL